MPYPNLAGKHAYDALVTPQDMRASLRAEGGLPDLSAVRGAILCYQSRIMDQIVAAGTATRFRVFGGESYLVDVGKDGAQIAVCGRFGIGAPVAAIILEELIALGIRRAVSVGTAGCLQRGMGIGDLVLCTGAIRDEGVSYHYMQPDAPALPDAAMTERLRAALAADIAETSLHVGLSWTIDAPYRETVEEARHYQSMGVQTVEMEAAALFAVAAHRGIEIASAFVISDSLAELVWMPGFRDPLVDRGLDALYAAAVATLLG
jgi:uridine phosphorylase